MSTTTPTRRGPFEATESTVVIVRFGVLALVAVIAVLRLTADRALPTVPLALLFGIAVLASVPVGSGRVRTLRPVVEAGAAALVIGLAQPFDDTLLPYLVVPPLAAGLLGGVAPAVSASAIELVVVLGARTVVGDATDPAVVSSVAQWVGLGLATGLVGAWARRVAQRERAASSTYVTAHGLLTRLRDVARTLPTGLDEVALAQQLLGQMQDAVPFDRGALYGSAGGGVLMPLAYVGADHLDWMPDIDEGLWGRVWDSGLPEQQGGRFGEAGIEADEHGHCAVLALTLGDRRVGLVALERDDAPWTRREMERAQQLVDDAALRIDTGQLFSEVRALATVEERRRLAREIHDGVAQEVAALGFVVDDIAAREKDPALQPDLVRLRDELTRIVSELRLSIFDLRSDVQPSTGLGAALSSYVRSVGTGSGLTVHLVLDESAYRLPIEAESELLRVAQEAITNARKHARARNLWVTCRVDPPRAFLRIADDGRGLGTARNDSFGMEIMRERAARLGATLTVRQRVGGGTVVEVTLGAGGGSRPSDSLSGTG